MALIKAKSKIHGYGLFSDTSIKKGELIGEFKVSKAKYETKFSIWLDGEMYRATNILKYSNYSSSPNAYVEFPYMYAKKNIPAGVEITWCYDG